MSAFALAQVAATCPECGHVERTIGDRELAIEAVSDAMEEHLAVAHLEGAS